jgi:hypothetical protein
VKRPFLLLFFSAPPAAAALVAIAACSSTETKDPVAPPDASPDVVELQPVQPVQPVEAGPAACKLTSDMQTTSATCNDCLQKSCCQAIVACLGEPVCAALNDCLNACRSLGTSTDAGVQCIRDCAAGKDEPAKRLSDTLDCESTRCGTLCK